MERKVIKEIHVVPFDDGTKYKNGKVKIKWVIVEKYDILEKIDKHK